MDQLSSLKEQLWPLLIDYGLELIGAVVILIIGLSAAKWLGKRFERYLNSRERFDETVTPLFAKSVRIIVIVVTILAVLSKFGVETASLIAVLGTIGLAVGLALQGTLSNVASGVMLLLIRPFNVGDSVSLGGTEGDVREISLFVTRIDSYDNVAITLPNSKVWGSEIKNYSANNIRRSEYEIGIGYEDNIDKATAIIEELLNEDERVLDDPEPLIAVKSLGDNAVILRVRPWTRNADKMSLQYDFTKRLKERFDEEGISFPYPQRDVHLIKENE